jgi:hypothetical protein
MAFSTVSYSEVRTIKRCKPANAGFWNQKCLLISLTDITPPQAGGVLKIAINP